MILPLISDWYNWCYATASLLGDVCKSLVYKTLSSFQFLRLPNELGPWRCSSTQTQKPQQHNPVFGGAGPLMWNPHEERSSPLVTKATVTVPAFVTSKPISFTTGKEPARNPWYLSSDTLPFLTNEPSCLKNRGWHWIYRGIVTCKTPTDELLSCFMGTDDSNIFSNFLRQCKSGSYLQSTRNYFLIYSTESFLKMDFVILIESTSRKKFA